MFTDKALKHANACRFCWMCRHLCPVGLQTGREVNTPRAKGLLISLDERGHTMDRDTAQIMYECTLCGSCTNACATGFDPPLFIREARSRALAEDLAPVAVTEIVDRALETGTVFESTSSLSFGDRPGTAKVLLYLGETARHRTPQMAEAAVSLLEKAGITFTVLNQEPASGQMLGDLIGYVDEVRQAAQVCAEALDAVQSDTVVVLDSYDLAFMLHQLPEWGIRPRAQLVGATSYLRGLVEEGRLTPGDARMSATYHDATPDARDLNNHESPRALLSKMGVEVHEMFLNRRMAKCCGSEVFRLYAPQLAKLTAEGRWDDAHRQGAHTMIVSNPQSFDVLQAAIPEGDRLLDLYTLLDSLV